MCINFTRHYDYNLAFITLGIIKTMALCTQIAQSRRFVWNLKFVTWICGVSDYPINCSFTSSRPSSMVCGL